MKVKWNGSQSFGLVGKYKVFPIGYCTPPETWYCTPACQVHSHVVKKFRRRRRRLYSPLIYFVRTNAKPKNKSINSLLLYPAHFSRYQELTIHSWMTVQKYERLFVVQLQSYDLQKSLETHNIELDIVACLHRFLKN